MKVKVDPNFFVFPENGTEEEKENFNLLHYGKTGKKLSKDKDGNVVLKTIDMGNVFEFLEPKPLNINWKHLDDLIKIAKGFKK